MEDFSDLDVFARGSEEIADVKKQIKILKENASNPVAALGSVMGVGAKKSEENLGRKHLGKGINANKKTPIQTFVVKTSKLRAYKKFTERFIKMF